MNSCTVVITLGCLVLAMSGVGLAAYFGTMDGNPWLLVPVMTMIGGVVVAIMRMFWPPGSKR